MTCSKTNLLELEIIEKQVVKAFRRLETSPLDKLDANAVYSYNYKDEMIAELQKVFEKIKSTGVQSLKVTDSKCKYCYPTANAYSFHNPKTDEFIIRYVIHQESEDEFRIEECRNKPIPDGKNGMPF